MNTNLVTTTYDAHPALALIRNSRKLGKATKDKYTSVLALYLETTGDNLTSPDSSRLLAEFADGLSNSRRAHLRAAVKRWAGEIEKGLNGAVTPDTLHETEATIKRLGALTDSIEVERSEGRKAHTWLSKAQVVQLSNAIGTGLHGARDRVAIGLLVAAGLRREEAVNLTWSDILVRPVGGKQRYVLAVKGKGEKNREVPISDTLAGDLLVWSEFVGGEGLVLRSLNRRGDIGDSLSAVALFKLVQKYGALIGKPNLAPHDLRRSYAQIGYQDGIDIGQISILLGHASIATTQLYLGIEVDHEVTCSDFVPW